ncbi:S-layer homology domain-containing protein [Romboutsia lituseburensis]|uniref:S-layer homology domain-containing protein n=1 Tax=Romboutsia lituseburensis TaxID=1537 RepID=UPI00215B567F|nr:S-layer homology domain-containing protein [Romboutsia lituseburensis]MCR8746920.1 S-layer homology domain-containing protein [Romboutsia lituseburensis]
MHKKAISFITLGLIFISSKNSVFAQSTSFTDINGHWAKSTIEDFVNQGYINGYSDNEFKPNQNMTRAEFVKIFNSFFGLTNKSNKVFEDTKSHWAKEAIDIAVTNGVCKGITNTEFKPNNPITRQEASVMISNYKNLNDNNHEEIFYLNDFSDISYWAKDSVEGVLERGYMKGFDNSFRPQDKITRAEAVSTLSRVHKGNVPPVENTDIKESDRIERAKESVMNTYGYSYYEISTYFDIDNLDNLWLTGKNYYSFYDTEGSDRIILVDKDTFKAYSWYSNGDLFQETDAAINNYVNVVLDKLNSIYNFGEKFTYIDLIEKKDSIYTVSALVKRDIDSKPYKYVFNIKNNKIISYYLV